GGRVECVPAGVQADVRDGATLELAEERPEPVRMLVIDDDGSWGNHRILLGLAGGPRSGRKQKTRCGCTVSGSNVCVVGYRITRTTISPRRAGQQHVQMVCVRIEPLSMRRL